VSQAEKDDYVRAVLPALASLRQHTGLPHRIVLDEAHYFLHDPGVSALLDLDLNGYTLVSYRASRLHPTLLAATQAIVVTRESDPNEVEALFALCGGCQGRRTVAEWQRQFDGLAIGEAVVLPVTEEAEGEVRRIHLAPRLTPHARHLAKYIDVPVSESRGFVFWRNGLPSRRRACTLREFVAALESAAPAALDGHLRRGDFSRWIADVFGDYPLAKTIRRLEGDYTAGALTDAPAALAQAIRSRYEFVEGLGSNT
jgi:hypothetical protein